MKLRLHTSIKIYVLSLMAMASVGALARCYGEELPNVYSFELLAGGCSDSDGYATAVRGKVLLSDIPTDREMLSANGLSKVSCRTIFRVYGPFRFEVRPTNEIEGVKVVSISDPESSEEQWDVSFDVALLPEVSLEKDVRVETVPSDWDPQTMRGIIRQLSGALGLTLNALANKKFQSTDGIKDYVITGPAFTWSKKNFPGIGLIFMAPTNASSVAEHLKVSVNESFAVGLDNMGEVEKMQALKNTASQWANDSKEILFMSLVELGKVNMSIPRDVAGMEYVSEPLYSELRSSGYLYFSYEYTKLIPHN